MKGLVMYDLEERKGQVLRRREQKESLLGYYARYGIRFVLIAADAIGVPATVAVYWISNSIALRKDR